MKFLAPYGDLQLLSITMIIPTLRSMKKGILQHGRHIHLIPKAERQALEAIALLQRARIDKEQLDAIPEDIPNAPKKSRK